MKTHNGLKSELHRSARLEPAMRPDLVDAFGEAEAVRHNSIYGELDSPEQAARDTLAWAERFVVDVERVIG